MDVIEKHEKSLSEKFGLKSEFIYSNTLCRIILMFIHRNKTRIALGKFRLYKNKYPKKIIPFEVAVFSLTAYAKFQLKRFLCLS